MRSSGAVTVISRLPRRPKATTAKRPPGTRPCVSAKASATTGSAAPRQASAMSDSGVAASTGKRSPRSMCTPMWKILSLAQRRSASRKSCMSRAWSATSASSAFISAVPNSRWVEHAHQAAARHGRELGPQFVSARHVQVGELPAQHAVEQHGPVLQPIGEARGRAHDLRDQIEQLGVGCEHGEEVGSRQAGGRESRRRERAPNRGPARRRRRPEPSAATPPARSRASSPRTAR